MHRRTQYWKRFIRTSEIVIITHTSIRTQTRRAYTQEARPLRPASQADRRARRQLRAIVCRTEGSEKSDRRD